MWSSTTKPIFTRCRKNPDQLIEPWMGILFQTMIVVEGDIEARIGDVHLAVIAGGLAQALGRDLEWSWLVPRKGLRCLRFGRLHTILLTRLLGGSRVSSPTGHQSLKIELGLRRDTILMHRRRDLLCNLLVSRGPVHTHMSVADQGR